MALTVTLRNREVVGQKRRHTVDIAFDSSYPTGGESLTAANVGLASIDYVEFPEPISGYVFRYDRTNSKVVVYTQGITTGSTVTADSTSGALVEDLAGAETAFRAMGTAVDTTYNMGPLKEATNTADLSALTAVRAVAWGR